MVVHQGAQCGYCTPGFVVAMSAMYETSNRVDEKQVRDGLTGNLCRCTGYEPIIKAALAVDATNSPKVRELYPHVPDARDAVRVENFFAPTTIEEAVRFKADNRGCTIIQGATDVGVWITKRQFTAPAMLFLGKIAALDELQENQDRIIVGANVTLAKFEEFIRDRIPELYRILNVFGSAQIRCAGTVVGNISARRGIVLSTDMTGGITKILAEVPLAETFGYATDLRSMTQGQGTFTMELSKYRPVPANLQVEVIAERKAELQPA